MDRKILLDRLSDMYGIQGTALTWFHLYLDNRGQSVVINGVKSDQHTLEYRVPQGSVMGPDLYCKYTKPVAGIISQHFIQYHLMLMTPNSVHPSVLILITNLRRHCIGYLSSTRFSARL